MQAEYRTLDVRCVHGILLVQFDTTAAPALVNLDADAVSEIFDVAHLSGIVTLDPPAWVPVWHAPQVENL